MPAQPRLRARENQRIFAKALAFVVLYGFVTLLGIAVWGGKGFALTVAISAIAVPILATFEPYERSLKDKAVLFAQGVSTSSLAMGWLVAPEHGASYLLLAATMIMFSMLDLYGRTKTKSVAR